MRAKKSLGQNFLKNKAIVKDIIVASNLKRGDIVLEIGPGKGILTEGLLEKSDKVIAIEKDDELFKFLKNKFSKEIEEKKLNLIHKDVLDLNDLDVDLDVGRPSGGRYKMVANIPYNITGEILRKFLSSEKQPRSMALLVQKEVAERIIAKDGKESILSISVKAYGKPRLVKKVKAENFSPKPRVDSTILLIENISKNFFQPYLVARPLSKVGREISKEINEEKFFKLVKLGFSQKRKFLKNNLKKILGEDLEKIFKEANIDPNIRAERLSLLNWRKLLLLTTIEETS